MIAAIAMKMYYSTVREINMKSFWIISDPPSSGLRIIMI